MVVILNPSGLRAGSVKNPICTQICFFGMLHYIQHDKKTHNS